MLHPIAAGVATIIALLFFWSCSLRCNLQFNENILKLMFGDIAYEIHETMAAARGHFLQHCPPNLYERFWRMDSSIVFLHRPRS